MIKFFLRFIILICGVVLAGGLAGGLQIHALVVASIFVCAWISIVSFEDIAWWIVAFAIIFGFLYYDAFALYAIAILSDALIYDMIHSYAVRTANAHPFILFIVAFFVAIVIANLATFITYHYIFIDAQMMVTTFLWSLFFFFFLRFVMEHIERVITLYNRGSDLRSHV